MQTAWILEAEKAGIHFFMQGGVGPEDWQRQQQLMKQYPGKIGLCYGLHPYWVIDHSLEECELALDEMAALIPGSSCLAVGEMGLDFRPKLVQGSEEKQLEVFAMQLELAEVLNLPIVLHLVQAHEQSQAIFDHWGVPPKKGMVHSFNGSWSQAQDHLQRGFMLSVGGPVCRPNNHRLREAVQKIPLDFLLLETDCPDQPPDPFQGTLNPLISLLDVARSVAEIKQLDWSIVLESSRSNFCRLVGKK